MENIKEDYARKLLEVGCNIKENDTLIVTIPKESTDVEEILIRLKDEYKIKNIIFVKEDYEELYDFLSKNPTDEEINEYLPRYPNIKGEKSVKTLYLQMLYEYSAGYYKLNYEIWDIYSHYREISGSINSEFWSCFDGKPWCLSTIPTSLWAENLLGDSSKVSELWNLFAKTTPSKEELIDILKHQNERKKYLNNLRINQLYFYTNSGTDLRIKLNKYSKWVSCVPTRGKLMRNFPSYEIYTSPNYLSTEGKVVVTRRSSIYGNVITEAKLEFNKGKVISCESDNDDWNDMVLYKKNGVYRIGEVALVSSDTPIARLDRNLNSLLLDENAGCHIALGNSLEECIMVPKQLIKQNGKKYYRFNESDYHQDLVFGDDSISVEARVGNKNKLLIKDGKWQI